MRTALLNLFGLGRISVHQPVLALTLVACSALPGAAQQTAAQQTAAQQTAAQETAPGAGSGRVQSVSVEIAQRSGKPPRDLAPGDVNARFDGQDAEVLEVVPQGQREPLIVLYFDYSLSRRGPVQRVADALRARVDSLLAFGPVEVVIADPEARTLLPATSEDVFLGQALDRVFVSGEGANSLGARRQMFLDQVGNSPPEAASGLAREAFADELAMLRNQHDELLRWLASRSAEHRDGKLLFVLDEALGADPLDFYLAHAADPTELSRQLSNLPAIAEVTDTANAYGWTVFPISSMLEGDDGGVFGYNPTEDTPVGFRLRLGASDRDQDEANNQPLFVPTAERWQALAAGTGGRTASNAEELSDLVDRLDARYLIRLRAPTSALGRSAKLDLDVAGGGLEVRAPGRTPGPSPEALSEVRVRRAFDGELGETQLELSARLELSAPIADPTQSVAARVETLVALDPPLVESTDESREGPWRVTIGVHTQVGETISRHEEIGAETVRAARIRDQILRHLSSLVLPGSSDSAVVVVEDLASGRWGASYVDFVDALDRSETAAARDRPERPLRLVPVDGRQQSGKVLFRTETAPVVERVVFLLNGRRVARKNRPPFEARIDLGDSGRTLQLVAVAFDRAGNEIDRDRLVINEPAESFWVRIVEPEPGGRHVGPTDVEARLKVPDSGRVDRVDFYWRNQLVGSAEDPPYRRRIAIPVGDPEGFLRAEAVLEDGRLAEDVLVMNRGGFGEQIGVELVELYLVASDRNGKPVLGLEQSDFRVLEDQKEQAIESFQIAGDLPLNLGLAIDSSSSLFLRMPSVKRAARGFVDSLQRGRDRAFLIGFGSEPKLVRSATGNFEDIRRGIDSLEPYGATAIWGALGMSLEQLEGMTGRKALVAFYDGDDEDKESEFERSLKLARRSRVPVYLVLVNNEAARTQGRSLSSRSFVNKLDRIARAGGGKVFYVTTDQDLEEIFDQIAEELRSHYLITYYPILEPGGPLWRPVQVDVAQKGVTARTIEGRGINW